MSYQSKYTGKEIDTQVALVSELDNQVKSLNNLITEHENTLKSINTTLNTKVNNAELLEVKNTVNTKANQSEVDEIKTTLDTKADSSILEQQLSIKADMTEIQKLTTAIT